MPLKSSGSKTKTSCAGDNKPGVCGMTVDAMKHPVVARLVSGSITHLAKSFTGQPNKLVERFKMIIKSLACPMAVLWDYHYENRQGHWVEKREFCESFNDAMEYLFQLDGYTSDVDLTYLKWFLSRQYQRGVGDEQVTQNHRPLERVPAIQQMRKHLFKGIIGRVLKQVLRRANPIHKQLHVEGVRPSEKCLIILSTFIQSKDIWPAMGDVTCDKTLLGHMEGLGSVPPPIPADLIKEIADVCDTVFGKVETFKGSKLSFSDHASFSNTRTDGGAGAEVLGDGHEMCRKFQASIDPYILPVGGVREVSIFKEVEVEEAVLQRRVFVDLLGELVEEGGAMKTHEMMGQKLIKVKKTVKVGTKEVKFKPSLHDFSAGLANWRDACWKVVEERYGEGAFASSDVRVSVVSEAGKFRPITLGDANLYYYLQPLQGELLSKWKLTSYSTMNDSWLDDLEGAIIPREWVWNSGDYKGATDNLNSNACRVAELRTLENLNLTGLVTHLTDAVIHYPGNRFTEDPISRLSNIPIERYKTATGQRKQAKTSRVEYDYKMKQENGQLMGHPLSFPFLCALNLAGLKVALRRAKEQGLINETEEVFILSLTKINGDDILFPCPPAFCAVWEEATAQLGLKLSIGKSYASKYFAVINSRQMIVTPNGLKRFEYVNFSLVENYNLKKEKDGKKLTPWEIGHSLNEMFELTGGFGQAFLPDAIKNRSEGLPITGYIPNFFVPCHYGGYGVDPKWSDKKTIKVSIEQRQVAALFHEDVMSSFAFASGLGDMDKDAARIAALLPECYPLSKGMDSYTRTETHKMRVSPKVRMSSQVEVTWESARKSYGTWLGVINSTRFIRGKYAPKAPLLRNLFKDKLRGINPMGLEKIFAKDYILTCPQNLPKPVVNRYSYKQREIYNWEQYAPVKIRYDGSSKRVFAKLGSLKMSEMQDTAASKTSTLGYV